MASHDYVRFLTERLVQYIDTPRAERKRRRKERQRDPWDRRWFGDIPFVNKCVAASAISSIV